ncbi:MAG: sensor histidine kinase [Chloroflexota bacterium]
MKRLPWVGMVAAPLALGLLVAAIFWQGRWANPILYLRIDVGTFVFFIGALVSLFLALEGMQRYQSERRRQRLLVAAQANAQNERRSFVRRLDHEVKNPLMAMRAGLANLSGTTLAQEQRDILASVDAQTLRLSRLLTDLRKLAELETQTLEFTPVDMGELLHEAVDIAAEHPKAQGCRIILNLPQAPWPLPHISGDRDLLLLLIHNLLDNALKFTPPGATIELRAFEDSTSVVIEVADTGPGIPEAEALLVWEELYRGEGARGAPGSGIGLALVQAITGRHGGTISLRSRLGQGTAFTLHLPRATM